MVQITTQSKDLPTGVFLTELRNARAVRDGELDLPLLPVLSRAAAVPATGQDESAQKVFAQVKSDICTHKDAAKARGLLTHKGLVLGGVARQLAALGECTDGAQFRRGLGENALTFAVLLTVLP